MTGRKKDPNESLQSQQGSVIDSNRGIDESFTVCSKATPGAPALLAGDRTMSYGELDQAADRVAGGLAAAGIRAGDKVGLYAHRSVDTVIAMLGILRAGAAHVPLDPTHAPEQLSFIAKDLSLSHVLVADDYADEAANRLSESVSLLWFSDVLTSSEPPPQNVTQSGEDAAHVLYTSGTTGTPKGVVIPHRAVVTYVHAQPIFGFGPGDVILHYLTIACDGATFDIWAGLLNGAAVAVVETPKPSLDQIADAMERHSVTAVGWYAGIHHMMIDHRIEAFRSVRFNLSGGDVMSAEHAKRLLDRWPDIELYNSYGPTETTVDSLAHRVTYADLDGESIPIGQPYRGDEAFVVGDDLQPLAPGEVGQLVIAGQKVALGYHNRPEKNAKVFIPDPRPGKEGTAYLTGDLARQDSDGVFHFAGRVDRQVKLGGRRIELDGIEHTLRAQPGVRDAAVVVLGSGQGRRIAAALITETSDTDPETFERTVLEGAAKNLHPEMLPRLVRVVSDFPLTSAGKVDRRAIAEQLEPAKTTEPVAEDSDLTTRIGAIWADLLGGGPFGPDATFFEAGGNSLLLMEAHARIEAELGRRFDIATLFAHPRLGDLAKALGETPSQTAVQAMVTHADSPIAIVGMAARLPGVQSLDEFWQAIREGRDLIPHFSDEQLEDDPARREMPGYVPVRPTLDGVEDFDAKFWGMLPREAAVTDPQARVFLDLCQQGLDAAGIDPARAPGRIGVWAGASPPTYLLHSILADRAAVETYTDEFQLGDYNVLAGSSADGLATRPAFKLDLKGPAVSLDTACSTSLTAVAHAITALRAGQADVALAGGVSITFPQRRGYRALEGGMASPDGKCRPFDADAAGTVFGHGAGLVVLRRLSDALTDGDHIHAVIRGVGLNNDGADKVAYTAPSVTGQSRAISAALLDGGLAPEDIGYIETHGTATPLGDPIEVAGLTQSYGSAEPGTIALGAVKGNLGHLDAAAGVVGLIKAAYVVEQGERPPIAHFKSINPRIDLSATPFRVPMQNETWDGPRRAGVSALGVGGTNVHVILENAPNRGPVQETEAPMILPLSAHNADALVAQAASLADALDRPDAPPLLQVARTLQEGRRTHDHRTAIAAETVQKASLALRKAKPVKAEGTCAPVFLFPGQGVQYPGMARALHAADTTFAHWIDLGCEALSEQYPDIDLRGLLLADAPNDDQATLLRQTRFTQPALYITQVATAEMWRKRGVTPVALVGHSVGEYAAAAFSGVFDFETGLRLIVKRAQLMQDIDPGVMLSVRAPLDSLTPYLGDGVDLAATNAPKLQVLSGPESAIAAVEARLEAADLPAKRLHTSHAFHSAMMDPVVEPLRAAFASVTLSSPNIQLISAVTGEPLTAEQATDAQTWADQARAPVRFADALSTAVPEGAVLIEQGPGNTLCTFAGQTLPRGHVRAALSTLPDHSQPEAGALCAAEATARLWALGHSVHWTETRPTGARKAPLPGTVFTPQRHWIDPPPRVGAAPSANVLPVPVAAEAAPVSVSSELPMSASRLPRLVVELTTMMSDLSGEELTDADTDVPFLELGFDSLFMGQVSQALARDFGVDLSFRSLLSDYPTIAAIADHLDATLPAEAAPAPAPAAVPASAPAAVPASVPAAATPVLTTAPLAVPASGDTAALIHAQMQTMQAVFAQQLQALGASDTGQAVAPEPAPTATPATPQPAQESKPKPKAFKTGRGPNLAGAELTEAQQAFAADLATRYAEKFPNSKAYTEQHRGILADPRTVSGFRSEWKELVFPVVSERAKGAYIWDIDGHKFMDLVCGFGQTAFGHSPDFVSQAVTAQMERGYPIGPQSDLAGRVAEKFAAATGHQRVTFCNTGSEAVMAAMRLARTVTGREKIVVFSGDYHGQFDEVLIKGRSRGEPGALPIAPGIPHSGLANMVVLPYGAPESLDWLKSNMSELAAVIVEPVQSRNPDLRPRAFVSDVRDMARAAGTAFVMDEVVTGFRTHPQGMQGEWDLQADMATYGKIPGGGMPIGVLAGDPKWMDALDGGQWQYGDDSTPQVAPTFFAGTFVRHPLVLAAVDATLDHLSGDGARLYTEVADRTQKLASDMRSAVAARGLPESLVESYSSWFSLNVTQHDPRATLLYPLMRMEGVHLLDGFCGFFTTAHVEEDFQLTLSAFTKVLDTLQTQGILEAEDTVREEKPQTAVTPEAVPTSNIPLTEGQKEIWLTHQLGDLPAASFNLGVQIDLSGPLDIPALNTALNELVARHDALRMVFSKSGETFDIADPYQFDLSAESTDLDRVLKDEAATPLDITAEPPFRGRLICLDTEEHSLILTAHHIAVDGWSYATLLDDLAALYTAATEGYAADLAPAPSYAAYAQDEAARVAEPGTIDFWRGQYNEIPPLPELPTDRPRSAQKSFAGASTTAWIDADLVKRVRQAGAKQGCTLFSTVFAALQITLARLSGSDDIVLGIPTAGQALLENQELVGHCVNFLPVRVPLAEETAAAHLKSVGDGVLSAFDHQRTTYGALVRELDVPRTLGRLPLTEVEYNLERAVDDLPMGPLKVDTSNVPKAAVNFDLFFNMSESKRGLRVDVDYAADLYDADTVQRWVGHLTHVLAELAENSDRALGEIPVMTEVPTLPATTITKPVAQTLNQMITEAAQAHPDQVAIEEIDSRTTYAELMSQADRIAAQIQANVPGQDARIAVALPRSASLIAALIGVHRAGHAYVPLEPTQPGNRLAQICETAEVAAILTQGQPDWANAPCFDPGEAPEATPVPHETKDDDIAYVIFTSGSTGTPKGVEIPHSALANFLASMATEPGLNDETRMLAVTTVSFDIAALELFGPLTVGGTTVLATREEVQDGFALVRRLTEASVTHAQATPTLWAMLLEAGLEPNADLTLLAGGEPLAQDLADRLTSKGATLWNMYGPTETTIWSALNRLEPGEPVTIGHPVANTDLHVLGSRDQLLPPGAIGELFIGGKGLARGYFNRADLTDSAFRQVNGRRLYATGDLAQRLTTGDIRILGRRDGQVKLRGFRIELGEIESHLRSDPAVAAAAVDLRTKPTGDKYLAAWVVPTPGHALDPSQLTQLLATQLPDYMLPSAWAELDALPETANGKLDRRALPEPVAAETRDLEPPQGETEVQLAAIWSEALGLAEISVTDTIYNLGADSLSIFRIAARQLDAGLGLEARHILANPTVRQLAAFHGTLDSKPKSARPSLRDFRKGARRAQISRAG